MSVDESYTGTVATPDPAGPPSAADEPLQPDPGPRRRIGRLGRRSLTARLVTGVVALVVLLVLAIGASTYYALSTFLNQRFNQQLESTATQNVGFFGRCVQRGSGAPAGQQIPCGNGPQTQAEWVAAFAPGSAVSIRFTGGYGNDLENLDLTTAEQSAIARDPEAIRTMHVDGEELRVTARQDDDGLIVVTGLSTREIDRTLQRLLAVELIIGAVAVAVALCATAWGVRRSLRNLYRVTGTAQEVAAELSPTGAGLDRRVPVAEEGTEVGQLAESFNTMLAAVQLQFTARLASEQRMRQFLADASHELRTPLTSIRGYAELARMQRAAGDTAQDNLDRIESEGTRMSRLVDDLLMLARGEAEQVQHAERVPVDIAELLDDAVAGSRAAFPERPISLEVTAMPPVLGDRDQLLRVVRNLITNAAVHTEAGRPIQVRGSTDIAGVVITVVDGGPRPAAGRRGARVRAVLARRQGPHPRAGRFRAGPVHRGDRGAGARRHGALRQRCHRRQYGHRPHPGDCAAADATDSRVAAFGTIVGMTPRDSSELDPAIAARLKRDAAGLVAAVVQQYDTHEVLMVGWMDDEALHRTLTTGRATYWSRSRREYWVKGETSGHAQYVKSVALDCDADALLVRVDQVGAACHTGDRTCFDAGEIFP